MGSGTNAPPPEALTQAEGGTQSQSPRLHLAQLTLWFIV